MRTRRSSGCIPGGPAAQDGRLNEKLVELIRNFRGRGHIIAALDPLGSQRPCPPELNLEFYNFSAAELDQPVNLPTFHLETPLTIREIFERLLSEVTVAVVSKQGPIDLFRLQARQNIL